MKDIAPKNYRVAATARKYNRWLRAPLAVKVFSRQMAA